MLIKRCKHHGVYTSNIDEIFELKYLLKQQIKKEQTEILSFTSDIQLFEKEILDTNQKKEAIKKCEMLINSRKQRIKKYDNLLKKLERKNERIS